MSDKYWAAKIMGHVETETRLLVTIPTFNEIENLPPLLDELLKSIPDVSVLVVDDDSPDGTGNWAASEAERNAQVNCVRRTGDFGLGSASIHGLKWGLDKGYELIATMDADFSHPPSCLSEMLEIIKSDANLDLIIGSRYVSGGSIQGWPLSRRIGSRIVNLFARKWLGLKSFDNTSALRIYRADMFRELNLASIRSAGFAYLEEVLFELQRANAKVVEHPFVFCDRERGASKLGILAGLSVLNEIFWMRFKRE